VAFIPYPIQEYHEAEVLSAFKREVRHWLQQTGSPPTGAGLKEKPPKSRRNSGHDARRPQGSSDMRSHSGRFQAIATDRLFLFDLALHQKYKGFGVLYLFTSQYFLSKPVKRRGSFPVTGPS
jgi:hypothetical protein